MRVSQDTGADYRGKSVDHIIATNSHTRKPCPPPKPANVSQKLHDLKRKAPSSTNENSGLVITDQLKPGIQSNRSSLTVSDDPVNCKMPVLEELKYDTINNNLTENKTSKRLQVGVSDKNNNNSNVVVLTINGDSNESNMCDIKKAFDGMENASGTTGSKIPILASHLTSQQQQRVRQKGDNNLGHKVYLNIEPDKVEHRRNGIKQRRSTDATPHIGNEGEGCETPSHGRATPSIGPSGRNTPLGGLCLPSSGRMTPSPGPRSLTLGSMIPRPITPIIGFHEVPPLRRHHHSGSTMSLSMSGRTTSVPQMTQRTPSVPHMSQSMSLTYSRSRGIKRGSSQDFSGPKSVSGISRIPIIVRPSLYSSMDCLEVNITYRVFIKGHKVNAYYTDKICLLGASKGFILTTTYEQDNRSL